MSGSELLAPSGSRCLVIDKNKFGHRGTKCVLPWRDDCGAFVGSGFFDDYGEDTRFR